jgi:hypothetical protein
MLKFCRNSADGETAKVEVRAILAVNANISAGITPKKKPIRRSLQESGLG